MRHVIAFCFSLATLYGPSFAHSLSDTGWEMVEYDGETLMICAEAANLLGCDAVLYPCETAFGLSNDADLATLPEETRHDLTACFMAYYDLYEVALWNVAPGNHPDPAVSRTANPMFNNMTFRYHRNVVGECLSTQDEKTEAALRKSFSANF